MLAHHRGDLRKQAAVTMLHHDEDDAVNDKRGGHHVGVEHVLFNPVVQKDAHHCGGQATNHDHAPQPPRGLALSRGLLERERVELMEIQDDDRHDGADLDHHQEQAQEGVRDVELQKLVDQDHVPGA